MKNPAGPGSAVDMDLKFRERCAFKFWEWRSGSTTPMTDELRSQMDQCEKYSTTVLEKLPKPREFSDGLSRQDVSN